MDALSRIEHQFHFTLPAAYRAFVERGYTTYPGDAYLWVSEAEWLSPSEMRRQGGFWGKPKPGLLDMPGVTPAQVAGFYEAAAFFFQKAPWKKVGYEAAIRVE